jgi:aspartyl-tRNA(Asn)/glutamyl-tRNA(Gln) amidotransferase subunit A
MSSQAKPLWSLTALELAEAYRIGAANPAAVTDACIERLEVVNPLLNAVVTVDRDGAMSAATASAERWRRGAALGPLDGVPVTVKDNLFVGGLRATWGSLLFAQHIAPQDDLPVAKLRSAGAVILGKTNTPELALAGYTDNPLFGPTGNPWAPALSPGGSSGGAAAALMSGIAPLALATDAGGSIRRPASHVGCVGLKPSVGRVPQRHGFPALAFDLQSIGPMARTVKDARALFDCVAQAPQSARDRKQRLRIAAFCRIGSAPVEPEVERVWSEARSVLEELGHEVCEISPPCDPDEAGELFLRLAAIGVARVVREFPDWESKVTKPIAQLARQGAGTLATAYVELIEHVISFRWRVDDAFAPFDLLLTPSAAGLLWPKTEPFAKIIDGKEAAPRAAAIYTTFGNVAGLAAISIPGGCSAEEHPVGVQLAGPGGSEELILDVAERFEEARPWPKLAMC